MSNNDAPPTVLLVHGAWHCPRIHYNKLVRGLSSAGFTVEAPELPTINGDKPPTKALCDDTSFIQKAAQELVDAGRVVLVLAHSYGGIVTTNALNEDLAYAKRRIAGLAGGIVQLVYLCAFMPQIGGSISSIIKDSGALLETDVDDQGNSIPKNPLEAFYGDVASDEANYMANNLITHPIGAQMTGVTKTAWRSFPITYIYCEYDRAIVVSRQREMVRAVQDASVSKIRTVTLKASHSPFLSHPQQTVEETKRAWNAYAEEGDYPEC